MRRTATLLVISAVLTAAMMWVFTGTPVRGQVPQPVLRKTQVHAELRGEVTESSSASLEFRMRAAGNREITVVADQDTVLLIEVQSGMQHTIAVSELRMGDVVTVSGTVLADGRVLAETVKVSPRTAQASRLPR